MMDAAFGAFPPATRPSAKFVEARVHLREALEARGWTYKSGSDGAQWSDTFCKPPLAAKLDLVQESGGGSTVSLALSWNELALLTCGGAAAAKS